VSELQSALDALASDDLLPMGDGELLDRTEALVRARNCLDAELTRTVRRAEAAQASERDGLKSMRSWLGIHTLLPDPAARGG
jgi:hypothetical protein